MGRDCILVDEIIDSGHTLKRATDELIANGARSVSAFATHGLFSKGSFDRIYSSKCNVSASALHNSRQPSRTAASLQVVWPLTLDDDFRRAESLSRSGFTAGGRNEHHPHRSLDHCGRPPTAAQGVCHCQTTCPNSFTRVLAFATARSSLRRAHHRAPHIAAVRLANS